jgi:REP element-mobilizing transposase RayT
MPRRLRLHIPGGIYHVTLRGNHRQQLFFADSDHSLLECIVARAIDKFSARLHAYCWMSNHLHLVMQAGTEPISRPMHDIAAEFARAMQLKMATTGHFFERRYHASLVDTDRYMLALLKYVHRNPVAAGICANVGEYRWSSHHNYTGARTQPWLTTDFALGLLSTDRTRAMAAYRSFVEAAEEHPWQPAHAQAPGAAVLGDDDFIARVSRTTRKSASRQTLEDLIGEACGRFAVERVRLASPMRDADLGKARAWIGYQAGKRGIATIAAVARELGRTEGALRYVIRAYPEEVE